MDDRVARCHILAQLLASDIRMTDDERAFLDAYMVRLQLSPQEREQVVNFEGADEAMSVVQGMNAEDKKAFLDDLASAALADGELAPSELALIKRLSESFSQ